MEGKKQYDASNGKSKKKLAKSRIKVHPARRIRQNAVSFCQIFLLKTLSELSQKGGLVDDPLMVFKSLPTNLQVFFRSTGADMVRNIFGAQQPKMRLRSSLQNLNTIAFGVFNPSVAISWFNIAFYNLWLTVFDEFKFNGEFKITVIPTYSSAVNSATVNYILINTAIAAIDYDDATVFATPAAVQGYDTAKTFFVNATPGTTLSDYEWEGRVEGIPDMTWTTTQSDLIVAWWKAYNLNGTAGWPVSVSAFAMMVFKADISFRQII